MNVDQMRTEISKVYDSWNWRERVKRMPVNQVKAIYFKMLQDGTLAKAAEHRRSAGTQMTIFDYGYVTNKEV